MLVPCMTLTKVMRMCVQGHALFTRQAGGTNPCPQVDFTGGFNKFMAAVYGVDSVQGHFGAPFSEPPDFQPCCLPPRPSGMRS